MGKTTMRITKVYTRTGDAGKTRLAGGQQVWKDSLRVEAYGTVDELNAVVGVVRVMNAEADPRQPPRLNSRKTCAGFRTNCSMSAAFSPRRQAKHSRTCRR